MYPFKIFDFMFTISTDEDIRDVYWKHMTIKCGDSRSGAAFRLPDELTVERKRVDWFWSPVLSSYSAMPSLSLGKEFRHV